MMWKRCYRCRSKFDPRDPRDWYCERCIGEISDQIRRHELLQIKSADSSHHS